MVTGRTVWDFVTEHPWLGGSFLILVSIACGFLAIKLIHAGYQLSPTLGWFVKKEIGSELDRRFAQAYIDTRDFKGSDMLKNVRGVNIKLVEYHKDPRRYTVYFNKPFPNGDYVAVANSTRGFVHITINKPDSVSLVDYDVKEDADKRIPRIVPGPEPGNDTGQITLMVYWPQEGN